MDLQSLTIRFVDFMWSGPIILYFCGIGFILTIALCFMQFRGFFKSIKYSFAPSDKGVKEKKDADLTPFQAFLSVLSASLGNGSLAGMGVAIAAGGPGAAFWLLIAGFFVMIIRYAEVYLGSHFIGLSASGGSHGGPVAYLSRVPGGKFLPYLFSFFCLLYGLSSGNAMQCNSVRLALVKTLGVSNIYIIALCIILFLLYVLLGGAHRIIAFSDSIVPVKVVVFFVSAVLLVVYHYASILPAIKLMAVSAFSTKALAGGVVGATVQKALQLGFTKSINATEAGLGTAAVFFGATGRREPVKNGLMSMFSAFISNYLVCFIVGLCIVASGAWKSGLSSTELTIRAYETFYGFLGAWVVTFCTLSFGIGVLVAYAYVSRECWLFLTKGRFVFVFNILYCVIAFLGTVGNVEFVWGACDTVNICLVAINLYGVLWLLPIVRKGTKEFLQKN